MPHLHQAALTLSLLAAALPAQKSGLQERSMKVDGKQRQFLVHIPRGYKAKQKKTLPLVLMLHGRTSNGRAAASRYYGWRTLADKEKFFAVFPTALGKPTSWQGAWRGQPTTDSRFLAQLIDTMLKDYRIDANRVFMTGHSSGGFMSYSFASTHADKIAAIGPVAGLSISRSKPKAPISVISFHGMADNVVAYDAKRGKRAKYSGMPSAIQSASSFAKHNGCAAKPERKDILKGKVHVDTWANEKNGTDVILYSIEGGDHGWPGSRRGKVAATKLIWEFFKAHGRGAKSEAKKGSKKTQRQAKPSKKQL